LPPVSKSRFRKALKVRSWRNFTNSNAMFGLDQKLTGVEPAYVVKPLIG